MKLPIPRLAHTYTQPSTQGPDLFLQVSFSASYAVKMSFSDKKPLFAAAASVADDENFEEDEDDSSSPQQNNSSASPTKPFSLFGGPFFSSPSITSSSASVTTAGVVEGEEDEDESTPSNSGYSGLPAPNTAQTPISTATVENSGSTGNALGTQGPRTTAKHYTKAERQVVDMNHAIRKAPVKKLKETFVQIRSEIIPTQNSLTASVRSASEASAQSAAIDQQLSALSGQFQAIKPLFSV